MADTVSSGHVDGFLDQSKPVKASVSLSATSQTQAESSFMPPSIHTRSFSRALYLWEILFLAALSISA